MMPIENPPVLLVDRERFRASVRTGIYVRAYLAGKPIDADISELTHVSLEQWLDERQGLTNRVVLLLLGYKL